MWICRDNENRPKRVVWALGTCYSHGHPFCKVKPPAKITLGKVKPTAAASKKISIIRGAVANKYLMCNTFDRVAAVLYKK
jgi:hypothetical protein